MLSSLTTPLKCLNCLNSAFETEERKRKRDRARRRRRYNEGIRKAKPPPSLSISPSSREGQEGESKKKEIKIEMSQEKIRRGAYKGGTAALVDVDQINRELARDRGRRCAEGLWDTSEYSMPEPLGKFIKSGQKGCAACTMVLAVIEVVKPSWIGTSVTEKEVSLSREKTGTITLYDDNELASRFELYKRVDSRTRIHYPYLRASFLAEGLDISRSCRSKIASHFGRASVVCLS
ncbi:hypothetical protein F5Y12DRAFT_390805 [Xylaria sp. FL1777]|nr:hypothetical protein F5Y12DRAFT_390805 [Xylaria sp. FL1777]